MSEVKKSLSEIQKIFARDLSLQTRQKFNLKNQKFKPKTRQVFVAAQNCCFKNGLSIIFPNPPFHSLHFYLFRHAFLHKNNRLRHSVINTLIHEITNILIARNKQ